MKKLFQAIRRMRRMRRIKKRQQRSDVNLFFLTETKILAISMMLEAVRSQWGEKAQVRWAGELRREQISEPVSGICVEVSCLIIGTDRFRRKLRHSAIVRCEISDNAGKGWKPSSVRVEFNGSSYDYVFRLVPGESVTSYVARIFSQHPKGSKSSRAST